MRIRCLALSGTACSPSVASPAGIVSGSQKPGHQARSSISLKHVYEIAKVRATTARRHRSRAGPHASFSSRQVKQTDPGSEFISLQSICSSIIGTARAMGVTVVR